LVWCTDDGRPAWTNRDAPGIVAAAKALGYGGPTNMSFIRLRPVTVFLTPPLVEGLGDFPAGLDLASDSQLAPLLRAKAHFDL
jgi:hypothetical protein